MVLFFIKPAPGGSGGWVPIAILTHTDWRAATLQGTHQYCGPFGMVKKPNLRGGLNWRGPVTLIFFARAYFDLKSRGNPCIVPQATKGFTFFSASGLPWAFLVFYCPQILTGVPSFFGDPIRLDLHSKPPIGVFFQGCLGC